MCAAAFNDDPFAALLPRHGAQILFELSYR